MEEVKSLYFQYNRESGHPVYLAVEGEGFSEKLFELLTQLSFEEIKGSEVDSMYKALSENSGAKQLRIKKAGHRALSQIVAATTTERYGLESILPKSGYKVYRYKGHALIVYSYAASAWECGVSDKFCQEDSDLFAARTILNRFISWSLASLGVVGFWGAFAQEGASVLKQRDSDGEAFFIDVPNKKVLSPDGVVDLPVGLKLLRIDHRLKGRNIRMSRDELLSFLSIHTSYFDPGGNSLIVRQLLSALPRLCEGIIQSADSSANSSSDKSELSP